MPHSNSPLSYLLKSRLSSLSERLKYLNKNVGISAKQMGSTRSPDYLKYNLQETITQILFAMTLTEYPVAQLEKVITKFNQSHSTAYTVDNFIQRGWIRVVNGQLSLPLVIQSYLWTIARNRKENKAVDIPEDIAEPIECLLLYAEKRKAHRLTISKTKLQQILKRHASSGVDITYLETRHVIRWDEAAHLYYWFRNDAFINPIKNEIAASLWFLIVVPDQTVDSFKRFMLKIFNAEIFMDDLQPFLSYHYLDTLINLSIIYLQSESDLQNSNLELKKVLLDDQASRLSPPRNFPDIAFNSMSPAGLIKETNEFSWFYHDTFSFQSVRMIYEWLIRLVLQHDNYRQDYPYARIIELLQDTSKPYIVYRLTKFLSQNFPGAIPYLTADRSFAPLALKLLNDIEINTQLIENKYLEDNKTSEVAEVKKGMYIELLEIILDGISIERDAVDQNALVLAEILIDLAESVFQRYIRNANASAQHDYARKLYDEVIKRLHNTRQLKLNGQTEGYSIRLFLSYLPEITSCLTAQLAANKYIRNEFLAIPLAFIDVSAELLKLIHEPSSLIGLSLEEAQRIQGAAVALTQITITAMLYYFRTEELNVFDRETGGTLKKSAHRGLGEFGLEIVDWALILLELQSQRQLQKYLEEVKQSIVFNKDADEYDGQNKEQQTKLKIHLKTLLIAYIGINQNRNLYEIYGLPVITTLKIAEKNIKELSLLHSSNDLKNSRIDTFDTRFTSRSDDIYYKPLAELLFRAVNYFEEDEAKGFVTEFFFGSIDVGRMLRAVNLINRMSVKQTLADLIEGIDLQKFIESRFSINDILNAGIEAINSEHHWELARPLVERLQKHLIRTNHFDKQTIHISYQIEMLLAYRAKDLEALQKVPVPARPHQQPSENKEDVRLKRFLIALYHLNHDKNYVLATKLLETLHAEDGKNARFAFNLYRAKTLKALQ